jgi:hypothetical protein
MDNSFDFVLKNVSVSSPKENIDVKIEQIDLHCSLKCEEKVAMKIYELLTYIIKSIK